MQKNKTGKYLKYAIGEIALVVIGILIALQVNNWNEIRKQNNNGVNVLVKLEKEFIENQILLNKIIPLHKRTVYSNNRLLEFVSPNPNQEKIDSLGYYVNDLSFIPKYTPNKSVLNSVISSGDINFIGNEKITYQITNWNGKIEEYNYWISVVSSITMDMILLYTVKNYPMKNMNSMKGLEHFDDSSLSKFIFDQSRFLSSMELENMVELRRLISIQLRESANEIQMVQDEIIQLIKTELNK